MDALSLIADMYRHMAWADALALSAIAANPVAAGDDYILDKLRHLHMVQKLFLDVLRNRQIDPQETSGLDMKALSAFARNVDAEFMRFLESLTVEQLESVVALPWSKTATKKLGFEVAEHSLAETLVQVPEHSAYHRGQLSARLRELGIDPPMTDFIAWIWRHKPEPSWHLSGR
jgi:uncharacterized damage-inducible protein DinB